MSEQESTLDEFVTNGESERKEDITHLVQLGPKQLKIPEEWNVSELEEHNHPDKPICYGVLKPGDDVENGTPLIKIEDLVDGTLSADQDFHRITDDLDEEFARSRLDGGELLISIQGSVGNVAVVPTELSDANISRTIGRITPTEVNTLWVKYYLESKPVQDYIDVVSSGSTRASYNISDIRKTTLVLPPLGEQRKIASVLYTVDQVIQKTEDIIDQTERVRQGVEQDLFSKGYYDHDEINERRLVELPTDWDFQQLSEHTIESAFGPRYDSDRYDEDGNIATLRTTDLDRRGNITHETMPRAELDLEEFEKHLLQEGDLVVSRSGAYSGITTTWEGYEIPTIPGAYMIRFRLRESLNPEFLRYYFNSSLGRERLNRRKKGSGQQNLAGSDLLNMRVPIPSKEEQAEIVDVIASIDERIRFQNDYRNRLQCLKQGLMQDLLSGEVRTHDKNIEIVDDMLQHG